MLGGRSELPASRRRFEIASGDRQRPGQVLRSGAILAAAVGTIGIASGAFWLSFTTLTDLAQRSGVAPGLAWVWPLIVDGLIVVATISVVALSSRNDVSALYAWFLLFAGAGVSVAANITHALLVLDLRVPQIVAALVACVPPLVLLAVTHLTVVLAGHSVSAPETASDDRAGSVSPERRGIAGRRSRSGVRSSTVRAVSGRLDRAFGLQREGLSNREIAAKLGVHPSTVGRWLRSPAPTRAGAERLDRVEAEINRDAGPAPPATKEVDHTNGGEESDDPT